MQEHDRRSTKTQAHFLLGLLLGIGLHITFSMIWAGIAWILAMNVGYFQKDYNVFYLLFPLLLIGATQMIYLLPAYIITVNRGRPELGKGIAVCAIVTALLSSGCFMLVGGVNGLFMLGVLPVLAAVSSAIAYWFTRRSR